MDLDVVVVTHQSEAALRDCMGGLPARMRQRIIVVDNASTDGSAAVGRANGARVLLQERNLGFGRAANVGARAATATHLCFLNPDCLPDSELFVAGLERLRAEPNVCAAADLCEPDGVTVAGCQPGYSFLKLLHDALLSNYRGDRLSAAMRRHRGFDDVSWRWPHGACFFVARDRFLRLGGFDESYFLYMEDVDFGRRFCRAGGAVVPLNRSVRHRARSGARIGRVRRLWHLDAARVRYAARHYGLWRTLAVAAVSAPGLLGHAVRQMVSGPRSRPSDSDVRVTP